VSIYTTKYKSTQSLYQTCVLRKQQADKNFIVSLNTNQVSQWSALIQASVAAGTCETQNRVEMNANQLIINKHQELITRYNQYISLIQDNISILAQYPNIIADPALISQISQISQSLN